jgi:hypothetical protein
MVVINWQESRALMSGSGERLFSLIVQDLAGLDLNIVFRFESKVKTRRAETDKTTSQRDKQQQPR